MGIFETYSKRQMRRKKAGKPDIYQYETLPEAFRVQVVHILRDAIGRYYDGGSYYHIPESSKYWDYIHDTAAREFGVFHLSDPHRFSNEQCVDYLLSADTKGALDIIDLSFHVIDRQVRYLYSTDVEDSQIKQNADSAIAELNQRFQEHGIGYKFEGGELMRVDSQYIHAQVVKPAISLLQEMGFRGAEDEFLRAHRHYRVGEYKEAVAEALKAFESAMKAICVARKWSYDANATARILIDTMFKNALLPPMLESQFNGLRTVLEGLPTVRNKTSGHGQGIDIVPVPDYLAAYALHLAASNIVFLVEAHKAKK